MLEIKEGCYKGTRILVGGEKRKYIDYCAVVLRGYGFGEVQIPIIQYSEMFKGKVGEENNNLMYNFRDRGERELCLAPEYTAVMQNLAKTYYKNQRDVKLFYVAECFRGEKPQKGRYRQFTQLGVEILNPTKDYLDFVIKTAEGLVADKPFKTDRNVVRGLDYYKNGRGFEIRDEEGMQLCGGGEYDGGIGFAIGVDRVI